MLTPSNQQITDQLRHMLASPDFDASPQQILLLKFMVRRALAGKAREITEDNIAAEVFGRGKDFDRDIDPIVRIQTDILRRALARYYRSAGNDDPIRIDIPADTWAPVFEKRLCAQITDTAIDGLSPDISAKSSWPSVLIRPLENLSGDPELDFWGIGLATELADELNRYPDIRVMTLGPDNSNAHINRDDARFIVDGSVRSDRTHIKMILKLTDTRTDHQIWSESSRSSLEAASLIAFQEELARSIAVKIAGERGLIMKTLDKESRRRPPTHSTVYQAVLRYIEYDMTLSPEAFSRALAALEKAIVVDPEYGPAYSMLARLYADIYTLDIPGFTAPLKKAFEFAHTGTRLSPADQRCSAVMAYIHMCRHDLAAGLAEVERALSLGPDTLFMLDGIGYLMTLLGDWERGSALIEKVMQLNPFYGNYVHFGLWVNYVRQEDYTAAYRESLKLNSPKLFWDHLARASTLGLLGDIEGGRKAAAELLKVKPDFPERGRFLIGHYIKFEEIVERVIEGLDAVGIKVKNI